MFAKLFPHPLFSALLAVIWLLLAASYSAGQVLLALLVGWGLPFFSSARHALLIHALNVEDEEELVRSIRERYEKPLQEIFG
jgi:multisubunit Na+/H+ antiporter MnhE subunit